MLRILSLPTDASTLVLRLEGKLLAPWIDELARALADAQSSGAHVALDLERLDFADPAGVEWLRRRLRDGLTVTASSRYLATLLPEVSR